MTPKEINQLYQQLPRIISCIRVKRNVHPIVKGRMFEDEVIKQLQNMKFDPLKAPGRRITIKGLSDVDHEQDVPFVRRFSSYPIYLVECKWRKTDLIEKDHVMIFNEKAMDIYFKGYVDNIKINKLYRIFVASMPLTVSAFKLCLTCGILVLTPFRPEIINRSQREGGPVILPPIEWSIVSVQRKFGRKPVETDKLYLLARLKKFRKQIFRDCSSLPNPNIHKGSLLLQRYRSLTWEVDPTKIVV